MRKIGILGGTFDPPHIGHLIIAEEVRIALQLEEVWFIPTSIPPHKGTTGTNSNDRKKMTEHAVKDNPYFKMNPIEMDRLGKSYTIDTMRALKKAHPDCEFYFIIGADMVEYLPKWLEIELLIQLVQFVGVKRFGYELLSPYDILEVGIPIIEISSSLIRRRLAAGDTTRYLIPEEVYSYIRGKGLYGIK